LVSALDLTRGCRPCLTGLLPPPAAIPWDSFSHHITSVVKSLSNLINVVHGNLVHFQRLIALLCTIWILKAFTLEERNLLNKFRSLDWNRSTDRNKAPEGALPGAVARMPNTKS
jgi:hypothetical protein